MYSLVYLLILLPSSCFSARVLLFTLDQAETQSLLLQAARVLADGVEGHNVSVVVYGAVAQPHLLKPGIDLLIIPYAKDDPVIRRRKYHSSIIPFQEWEALSPGLLPEVLVGSHLKGCASLLEHQEVLSYLSKQKFTILITTLFMTDQCGLFLADYLNIKKIIGFESSALRSVWSLWQGNAISPLSLIPLLPSPSQVTSMWSRFSGIIELKRFCNDIYKAWHEPARQLIQSYMSLLPKTRHSSWSIENAYDRIGMLLVHSDPSLYPALPLLPNVNYIGGFHCSHGEHYVPSALPSMIEMKPQSVHGLVLISLGSHLVSLPVQLQKDILTSLSKMDLVTVWENTNAYSSNINITLQNVVIANASLVHQVLEHPSCRVLVSGCDEASILSAFYHSVPIVCLPWNPNWMIPAQRVTELGAGILIQPSHLTGGKLRQSVMELINNRSYRKNARKISESLRHRPLLPVDYLLYWVTHFSRLEELDLKLPTLPQLYQLSFIQYHLIDMLILFLLILGSVIGTVVYIIYTSNYQLLLKDKDKGE